MKRKIVIVIGILIGAIGVVVAILFQKTLERIKYDELATTNRSHLPEVTLLLTDSSAIALNEVHNQNKVVIVYFNSTCEHCQYEARDLKNNIEKFSAVKILMVSSEPLKIIVKFAESSGLRHFERVVFAKITHDDLAMKFGTLSVPHILIYDRFGNLEKEFEGETKAEALARFL